MNGSINNRGITYKQFMFSIICFMQASILLTSFIVSFTKQDTWFVILLSVPVMFFLIFIYVALIKSFPGKNLMQINEAVFGKVAGKIISFLYLFSFLTLLR